MSPGEGEGGEKGGPGGTEQPREFKTGDPQGQTSSIPLRENNDGGENGN